MFSLIFFLLPHTNAVPVFTISPSNITVSEDDTDVTICISRLSDVVLARDVVVTAQTGFKTGANDQATGRSKLWAHK